MGTQLAIQVQLNEYYEALIENPSGVRSLADLIAFNDANPELEEPTNFTDQSELIEAEGTDGFDAQYTQALAFDHDLGRTRGIDAALQENDLDALLLPATGFTTTPAAIAGYPIVTVPLGFFPDNTTIESAGPLTVYPAPGVPFGLSFLGTAFSEVDLISFAFAYEQKTQTRLARKAFDAAIPKTQLVDVVGVLLRLARDLVGIILSKNLKIFAIIKLRFGFGVGTRGDEVVVGGKKVEMGKSFFGSDFTFTASNAKTYKWLYATPHPPRDTPPHVIAYFDDGRVGHYTRGPASIFVERAAVGEGLLDEIIATLVYVQRRYGKQPPPSGSVPRRRGGAGGGGAVGYDGGGAGFGGSDGGGCGGDGGGGGGDGGGC
ncbi:hypothetical protein VNI00_000267 [Paramarasmius palmivorus]|uniref:DUF6593 domain-containing protein n=1 Tax=Paramarasmius palmivorus TaxID=297713 RepID=A0AAW0EDV6_9AGAR